MSAHANGNGNGRKPANPARCERVGCRKVPPAKTKLCLTHQAELASLTDPDAFPWKQHNRDREKRAASGLYVTKLTTAVVDKLCEALESGAPVRFAAAYAGIGQRTLNDWMHTARGPNPKPEYMYLADRVEVALSNFVVGAMKLLGEHGKAEGNWTPLAWQLERRFPDEFGRRQRLDVGNADGEPFKLAGVDVELETLTPEELAVLKIAAQRQVEKERALGNVIDITERRAFGAGG